MDTGPRLWFRFMYFLEDVGSVHCLLLDCLYFCIMDRFRCMTAAVVSPPYWVISVFLYYERFQVYDGGSVQSPLLGRFCGAQIPAPVSSTQNMMTVKFVTDGSQHNTGFMASYTSSSAGACASLNIPSS